MLNLRPFQIFLIAIFTLMALLSIVIISVYKPAQTASEQAFGKQVVIWGTLPYKEVDSVLDTITKGNKAFSVVRYVNVRPEAFDDQFVNAIAEGQSPDLVIMPHTDLVRHRSKLQPIPYSSAGFAQRDIKSRYIDGAEIFALSDGLYAIPIAVDPLVMYWNRDLLATAGFAVPPATWEQLVGTYVAKLTKRDNNRNISQSAVAFGEYRNVENSFSVISMLALQSGSKMVTEANSRYVLSLNESSAGGQPPMQTSVQFYADFANPASALYSWSRAKTNDQLDFLAGTLALYFGHGSEAAYLQAKNPNLNFDVATVPQGASATIQRTYGTFYGLAIPKAATNKTGAYNVALLLTDNTNELNFTRALQMAPASRSLLAAGGEGTFEAVVYRAALVARGWLSPSLAATDSTFATMVEDVISNRKSVSDAVSSAIKSLSALY